MAGTEHNTRARIPLEPHCVDGSLPSSGARAAFWEATCVMAAHQHLRASGKPGYVDGEGRLNPGFPDGTSRVHWFAEMGRGADRRGVQGGGPMSALPPGRRELPPTPVATLDALIEIARRYGRDPEFSRGGGGNASAKVGRRPVHQAERRRPRDAHRGRSRRAGHGAAPRDAPVWRRAGLTRTDLPGTRSCAPGWRRGWVTPAGAGPPWSCCSTPSCPSASSCTPTRSRSTRHLQQRRRRARPAPARRPGVVGALHRSGAPARACHRRCSPRLRGPHGPARAVGDPAAEPRAHRRRRLGGGDRPAIRVAPREDPGRAGSPLGDARGPRPRRSASGRRSTRLARVRSST